MDDEEDLSIHKRLTQEIPPRQSNSPTASASQTKTPSMKEKVEEEEEQTSSDRQHQPMIETPQRHSKSRELKRIRLQLRQAPPEKKLKLSKLVKAHEEIIK